MGRKNDAERGKRRQRKREKRKAKSDARRTGGPRSRGGLPSPAELGLIVCIDVCQGLLADAGPLEGELREMAVEGARLAGRSWSRLLVELERFMTQSAPWTLSCSELEPLRRAFARHDAEEAFGRLWTLALTNEAHIELFAESDPTSCADCATRAFVALLGRLELPARDFARGFPDIRRQMEEHGASAVLVKDYEKLLRSAHASVHKRSEARAGAVADLVSKCRTMLARHSAEQSDMAWWQSGRLFLAEIFNLHIESGYGHLLAEEAALLEQLYGGPEGSVRLAGLRGSTEPLRAIHFRSTASDWLGYLEQRIDPAVLGFEDRVRYEIARLKLARARPLADPDALEDGESDPFLPAFARLRSLLARGVPPANRDLPAVLEPALVDVYVEAVQERGIEGAALETTEALLRAHPDDFRLACLYATGALLGKRRKLDALAGRPAARARFDAELFGRCARLWAGLPDAAEAAAIVRPLLFDGLDREHRKRCLVKLSQQALGRAESFKQYDKELAFVLPFIGPDDFVFRELREGGALESALVFLATMAARLHGLRLALGESQSLQWVSHAREIANQSAFGARLAARYLKTPARAFSLAPSVRAAALAERNRPGETPDALAAAASGRAPRQGGKGGAGAAQGHGAAGGLRPQPASGRPSARKRRRKSGRPQQGGLFDALDP